MWDPAATSIRARCLSQLLPKAWSRQCLSICGMPPNTHDRRPRSLPWVDERGERGRRVVKSRLPVLIIGWRSDDRGSFSGLVLFRLVAPLLQPGVVGPFPGMWCMVPQPFAVGGNRSYPEFWAVTGGPRYPGYTLIGSSTQCLGFRDYKIN
jgi:hypothetical protein